MNQPTLGLLEKIRPPAGFRTEAVFATSYSADLLACMAVLTTLDGGEGEQVRYGRVEAYRALDRLRDRVRVFYNLGCLSRRDGRRYPSLALLDRVLVPVRVSGTGSFHPKVWLVRQVADNGENRYVLLVSSRNVTTSTDWDFGVVVQGGMTSRGVALPRLSAFVDYVTKLGGDTTLQPLVGDLDGIRWELPRDVEELTFDFQEGTDAPRQLHSGWSRLPPRPSELLILSPFIDGRMVSEASRRWKSLRKRRLVAGSEGLTAVALGSNREALAALEPYQLTAAPEVGSELGAETGEQSEEEDEQTRALHAKLLALTERSKSTIVVGSNNLTSNGWCGGSTEAFVTIRGDKSLSAVLWEWANNQALLFEFPPIGTPVPSRSALEEAVERLRSLRFRLDESGVDRDATLSLIEPGILEIPDGMRLDVCRYTTPLEGVSFPKGAGSVTLPGCKRALRTRFIGCSLHDGDEQASWTTQVDVIPPLEDDRDRELVAQLLGPREFLAYLQSLRRAEAITGVIEGEHGQTDTEPPLESLNPHHGLSLEGLLRQMAEEPETFAEIDGAIRRYGELIIKSPLAADQRSVLLQLMTAWEVIREASLA